MSYARSRDKHPYALFLNTPAFPALREAISSAVDGVASIDEITGTTTVTLTGQNVRHSNIPEGDYEVDLDQLRRDIKAFGVGSNSSKRGYSRLETQMRKHLDNAPGTGNWRLNMLADRKQAVQIYFQLLAEYATNIITRDL